MYFVWLIDGDGYHREPKIGISKNPEKRFKTMINDKKSTVKYIITIKYIHCTNNVKENPTKKRRLEAYIIEQSTLSLFQPHFYYSELIRGGNYECFDTDLPVREVKDVMQTLADAIDMDRIRVTSKKLSKKDLEIQKEFLRRGELPDKSLVARNTPKTSLIDITNILCKESGVNLTRDSICQYYDYPYNYCPDTFPRMWGRNQY